jgi:membrane protease YdiL (CAAX protease family)
MTGSIFWKRESLELRNLILFFIIAFGWSWIIWFSLIRGSISLPEGIGTPNVNLVELVKVLPILILSPFGPTISAFFMTFLTEGKTGIKQFWSRFWNRDLSKEWLIILILLQPTYFLVLRILSQTFGISQPTPVWISNPLIIIPPVLTSILNGGLSEEFGWRGYALPRLQARFSAFSASLILGIIEGLWHYPLIVWPADIRYGMSIFVLILWQTIATYFRTWIFNSTNGSILAAVLFHAVQNSAGLIVPASVLIIQWLPQDPYVPSAMIIVGYIFVLDILLVSSPRDMITVLRARTSNG